VLIDYILQLLRDCPCLICLDDFQYVHDDPKLNLFVERLRAPIQDGTIMLILASRRMPDFVQAGAYEALAGLDQAGTAALLGARLPALPERYAAELYALTGGNPQFLTMAADALGRTADPGGVIARLAATDNVEGYLLAEVDRGLSDDERAVLSAVALMLGYPATRDAIEAVLDRNAARVLKGLAGRHLLSARKDARGEEYLAHAMIQRFYYDMLSKRERQSMHGRAGEYYLAEARDALQAARHFQRAGQHERAAGMLAGEVWPLINQGHARALRLLIEQFAEEQLAPLPWVRLNLALGEVCAVLADEARARAAFDTALGRLDTLADLAEAPELRARACRGMGQLQEQDAPAEALEWFGRGLDALAGRRSEEEAAIQVSIGTVLLNQGKYAEALASLTRALALLPEGPSYPRNRALVNMTMVYVYQGDHAQALVCAEQALAMSRRLNDLVQVAGILDNAGVQKFLSGAWREAIADFEEALELAMRLGSEMIQASAQINLGAAYLCMGETAAAQRHLAAGLGLARKLELQVFATVAQITLADLYIRAGMFAPAEEALQAAEQLAHATEAEVDLIDVHVLRADLALARGQAEEALREARRAVDLARSLGEDGTALGMSLRLLGQALAASAQHRQALARFEESLAALDGKDSYEAARTRMQWGRALREAGDAARGGELLRQALASFQALGARREIEAVEALLAA
jgi:ATP/maltotriose-dependent transcriptional regulator MalT